MSKKFQPAYDLVIIGGRVIDPETGLDAVRNVGIKVGIDSQWLGKQLEGKTSKEYQNEQIY